MHADREQAVAVRSPPRAVLPTTLTTRLMRIARRRAGARDIEFVCARTSCRGIRTKRGRPGSVGALTVEAPLLQLSFLDISCEITENRNMNLFTLTPYAPTPRRADALARIAEINEEIKRIDNALDNAQLTWLRSVQSLALDQTYQDGCQQLETLKTALHGEVAVVRMKALL